MADFVHRHFLQALHDQLLEVGIAVFAGRHHRGAEGQLARHAAEQDAVAAQTARLLHVGRHLLQSCAIVFEVNGAAGHGGDAFGRERLVFLLPELQEVGVEDDVGIENLAGPRIHARRAPSRSRRRP